MRSEKLKEVMRDLNDSRNNALLTASQREEELLSIPAYKNLSDEQTALSLKLFDFLNADDFLSVREKYNLKTEEILLKKAKILGDLGLDISYLKPPFSCQNCDDKGHDETGKLCACVNKRLVKKVYEGLSESMPAGKFGFSGFSLAYYPDEAAGGKNLVPRQKMAEVLAYCQNYAASFSRSSPNVLMIGETGLGKTHLSIAIAKEVAKKGYDIIYASSPNLLTQIEKEKFSGAEGESLASAIACDLLILDDLGTEFQTAFSAACIYQIINTRMNQSLPTIINTNLSYRELEKNYSPRILSRISGSYDSLYFIGKDVRMLKKLEMRGKYID